MFIEQKNPEVEGDSSKLKTGFAVLFSIMIASFLITLGLSIFTISLKEIQITTSVRDSQLAYYAADSARECVLYWDIKLGAFPTCLDDTCSTNSSADQQNPTCNGVPIALNFSKDPNNNSSLKYWTGLSPVKDFFQYSSLSSSTPVSDIRITKTWIPSTQSVQTKIETWGHNTGILGRRVERGMVQINN